MESYKSGQGSLTRLTTVVFFLIVVFLGCVELFSWIQNPRDDAPLWPGDSAPELLRSLPFFGVPLTWKFLLCVALFIGGVWLVRRYLARPKTADTLIETEMEMRKVSWPTRDESMNATWVVILVSVLMTLSLIGFDFVLQSVFGLIF